MGQPPPMSLSNSGSARTAPPSPSLYQKKHFGKIVETPQGAWARLESRNPSTRFLSAFLRDIRSKLPRIPGRDSPPTMDYHLIIIGGGAAGKDAALFAARAGIKTLLVEKDQLGGTSYQRGCYAMRALQACASAAKSAERSEKFGIGIEFFDTGWAEWSRVRHRVTSRLTRQLSQDLTEAGIIVDYGTASFIDNHQIQISDASGKQKTLTAENFIIATGSKPIYPGTLPVPLGKVTSLRWIVIPSIVISCSSTKESQPTSLL